MELNQKNENESKCVLELYEYCEKGLYTNIKRILEDNDFSSKTLDIAIRKCMKNRKRERNEYHDSLNLLLQYVNVNFKNPIEDNSTIFMYACKISDVSLIEIIFGFDFSLNQTYPNAKIDLGIKDDYGRNFLHYLINKDNQEEEAVEVFDNFFSNHNPEKYDEIPEFIENSDDGSASLNVSKANSSGVFQSNFTSINITTELNIEDNEGYTPLSFCLLIGWASLSKRFLLHKARTNSLIRSNFNNMTHLAVLGKNLNCIKLILTHSSIEEVKHKNKDDLTPKELAKSLKLKYYSKIIENFEENCLNPSFISIFTEKSILVNDILEKFYLEDYTETMFFLNQLKVNQSILSTNSVENVNLNIEWNIFLTKYYIKLDTTANIHIENQLNSEHTSSNWSGKVNRFDVCPESILSKFIEGSHKNLFSKKLNVLYEFKDFFDKINTDGSLDEDVKDLDIIIYNKGIFYYKQGDFIKTTQIFSDYLKFHLSANDTMYYKWFLYVNISFILIEGLIFLKYTKLASCIIEKIEEFLFTHYRTKKDETFTSDLVGIRDYLHYKEVINQFTPTWDESFCFVNILKAMRSIYEVKMDEAKNYMKEFKKLYKQCNYKDEVKVVKSMHYIYTCLKIQMFYYENSFSKCFKSLNKIYKLLNVEQINIRINDHKIDERFNDNEYILFYFNSMGIINLKQKKFQTAEIFFKAAINHYKKIYLLLKTDRFDFSIRLESIYNLKYNLGLCYFFQKKFDKALVIFRELVKNKNMNMNIFMWYRLGLCLLEIELAEIRRLKVGRNDTIVKTQGYDPNNQGNFSCAVDGISMKDLTENEGKDENEEDDLIDNGTVNLNFIDEEDTPAPFCAKRIILQNNFNGSYGHKRKINEAVGSFKQVLLLSTNNINCNSKLNEKNELNEIYNFFFDKKSAYMDSNYSEDPFERAAPKIKSLSLIMTSTYLNLVFCLSITENWTEVLFYCNLYEQSEYYKKDKDAIYKFDNFKIEALINLKETNKAVEIIKNNISLLTPNDFRGSFFNNVNAVLYHDVSYKIVLNINLAKIHFINNNNIEAEKCIANVIMMINTPNAVTDLPPYIQNLFIYSNLVKGNYQSVLNLIKFRKLFLINPNPTVGIITPISNLTAQVILGVKSK